MKTREITVQDIEKNKELAALSYMWVFSLIILVARRDSEFVQHHARQGLILFLVSMVIWPFAFFRALEFFVLAFAVLGFINAATGKVHNLPVVGAIADGTFGWHHVRKGIHHVKHAAISAIDPAHVTPQFREELEEQHVELQEAEQRLDTEEQLIEQEERKLSSLFNRLQEDEKEIQKLEDEVHEMGEKIKELTH